MEGPKRKRVKRTSAEIATIIEAFEHSGMSAARFAAANDLPISTFRLWLRRCGHESGRASPSRFVPVTIVETEPSTRPRIEIALANGRSLSVPADIDPGALAALLPVLDDACS